MKTDILLSGNKVALKTGNRELWHEFYKNYVIDPMMDETPYTYDFERIERAYNAKTSDATRLYFAIMHEGSVVGQIYLKHIDTEKKTAEFGIALSNDAVKGKGYGTEAIKLLIDYAFNEFGIECLIADAVHRNTRSRHVLEKLGFINTHEDSDFKYFKLEKNPSK